MRTEKQDIHTCITYKIIADLERGVRTWMKPWNAVSTTGRIIKPLRHNGVPYSGINVLMLWAEAMDKGLALQPGRNTNGSGAAPDRAMPAGRAPLAERDGEHLGTWPLIARRRSFTCL